MQSAVQARKKNPFKAHRISELLLKFSAPALMGMLVNALNNIISRIFIGHDLGTLGIAAVTIIFPVSLFFMAVSMLIGVGANALFSIRLGEHRDEDAEIILGNAFSFLTILSLISVAVTYIFMDQILNLCGATPDILPYAKEYCVYVLPGYFIFIISAGLNNFIRSSGKPKTAMATQFIIALTNIICTPVFIFVFHWGLKGAALAIVAGDLVSTVWIMAFFLGKRAPYRLRLKNLALRFDLLKDVTYIGFAQFVKILLPQSNRTR
jgi:Na+-driven multidrug efflux pump